MLCLALLNIKELFMRALRILHLISFLLMRAKTKICIGCTCTYARRKSWYFAENCRRFSQNDSLERLVRSPTTYILSFRQIGLRFMEIGRHPIFCVNRRSRNRRFDRGQFDSLERLVRSPNTYILSLRQIGLRFMEIGTYPAVFGIRRSRNRRFGRSAVKTK